jgi:hypothetical protein
MRPGQFLFRTCIRVESMLAILHDHVSDKSHACA